MMHELAFTGDSLDACAFAIKTLRAFLPATAILVHLYDRAKREYAIAHVHGAPELGALVGHRTPESDLFVQMVLQEKETKLIVQAPEAPGVLRERHTLGGGRSQVLVHPVHLSGQMFALIEIVDPQHEFDERQRAALVYLSDRLAEFFSDHAMVLPVACPAESGTLCYHCVDGVEHECRLRGDG